MKHIYGIAVACGLLVSSCGGKKTATVEEEQQRVLQIDSVDAASGVQRMKVSQYNEDVTIGGRAYHIAITREPDDAAPTVKSEVGTYVDNKVTLRISRADGSEWVNRTVRKSDFAAIMGDSYTRHFILEGLVYDEERTQNENRPVFATSISVPMTDLYIPFIARVNASGQLEIVRDEDMDVLPQIDEEKTAE